jgi:hypothetical protein
MHDDLGDTTPPSPAEQVVVTLAIWFCLAVFAGQFIIRPIAELLF